MAIEEYQSKIADALIDVLKRATSREMMEAQLIIARRLALEGDVAPSRVPPPLNITELGGYINLLGSLDEPALREQVLASVLGVAGPNPPQGWFPIAPPLYFATRTNDRPGSGEAQAAIPLAFEMRSDFVESFSHALDSIHDHGCALPVLSEPVVLPPTNGGMPSDEELLKYVGRTLELVPSAALDDSSVDPLAVARVATDSVGSEQVVARLLDPAAPNSSELQEEEWTTWIRSGDSTFIEDNVTRHYLALEPLLAAAGWYRPQPIDPTLLGEPKSWAQLSNISGLVSGRSKYGEELNLLYTREQIAMSSLREATDRVWDGSHFVA